MFKFDLGECFYCWNWQVFIYLFIYNFDILYMGVYKMLCFMDQGEQFEEIFGDFIQGGVIGDVFYGIFSSIYELFL